MNIKQFKRIDQVKSKYRRRINHLLTEIGERKASVNFDIEVRKSFPQKDWEATMDKIFHYDYAIIDLCKKRILELQDEERLTIKKILGGV